MKKILLPILAVLFFGFTFAHQPRLVFKQPAGQVVNIQNPEVSQAFYGILSGQADTYQIIAETRFLLYINILAPDLPDSRTDFTVDIIEGNDTVAYTRLDGENMQRSGFFEPFGGDMYLKGPSREKEVPGGIYTIKVSNPDNQGKYSLAIGKLESFPSKEMIKTFKVMPDLKMDFFDKPRYTIFRNYVGLIIVGTIIILMVIIRGTIKIVKCTRHK